MFGFLKKLATSVLVMAICLAPLWIFLLAKAAFNPTGFWQRLALAGLGLWVLGGIQIFAGIGMLILLLKIWTDPPWS